MMTQDKTSDEQSVRVEMQYERHRPTHGTLHANWLRPTQRRLANILG